MTAPLLFALELLGKNQDLTERQTADAVTAIMTGDAPEPVVAAFLTALRLRGETAANLTGAVTAVRERAVGWPVDPDLRQTPLLDTCGTGGDGACTVNISTATAIVVAATGVAVAKHGNRSASGNSGSAEVLAELGVKVDAEIPTLVRCLRELNLTFLFAPKFHPALRFAASVRRQLPFRTLFNLVGPLANPARPTHQLIGVPDPPMADLVAAAIARLGVQRAAVVTGGDGLDEVSLSSATQVRWVENGQVETLIWPRDAFGLPPVESELLRVSGPLASALAIRKLLDGERGPIRDTVLANSSAALLVAGAVADLPAGVGRATQAIENGAAAQLLRRWADLSQSSPDVDQGLPIQISS